MELCQFSWESHGGSLAGRPSSRARCDRQREMRDPSPAGLREAGSHRPRLSSEASSPQPRPHAASLWRVALPAFLPDKLTCVASV